MTKLSSERKTVKMSQGGKNDSITHSRQKRKTGAMGAGN